MKSRVLSRSLAVALLLALAGGIFLLLKYNSKASLPPGITSGNGRLEATEVDVATKVPGRLAAVRAREGDNVGAGQIVAELDAEDLRAQLRAAEAQVRQAHASMQQSQAGVASAGTQRTLAKATLDRTGQLVKQGFVTGDRLDRDQSALQAADAGLAAARSKVSEGGASVSAAVARVDALRVALNDATIKAPLGGRVLYRLAEPGEVIAGGGKILTLLDMTDVYVSIYLPTAEAGKVALGSPARIALDALPGQPIPAKVVFVAPRSQFTPKEVETRSEREKLMFRVKVKVDAEWLAAHVDLAKPGMPGVAYVLTDPGVAWPPALTTK
ncbi:MAG: efflux RND transporter periplasmic adaptor subunit [Sulfuritalea sp.]|jgi:HlyD family secretion protein|nr:efflux RND transporter periplasmic adaptor subunit [Sulfuritalea sp.]